MLIQRKDPGLLTRESWVRILARPYYSHTGQPSVDPVVLFKALLVGCLYGITSERWLMEETQVNLAYRWFLVYDLDEAIPNDSVLVQGEGPLRHGGVRDLLQPVGGALSSSRPGTGVRRHSSIAS